MAKIIKYKILSAKINYGTEENSNIKQTFLEKFMTWSEANEAIAKREAHNGEIEIYDDGQPDPNDTPSQLDIIEAQVTYTALMTDTLLVAEESDIIEENISTDSEFESVEAPIEEEIPVEEEENTDVRENQEVVQAGSMD